MVKWLDLNAIHFDEIHELVLDASRKAFREIPEVHSDETFYAFGFYQHSTHFGFMLPACHSEEAHKRLNNLTEADRERQCLKWFYRRWQPDHWEYLYSGQEHFLPAWEWVKDNLDGYVRPRDQELLKHTIDYNMTVVCLKVLSLLDSENFFGEGTKREGVVLLLSGDQLAYNEEKEYTLSLNPVSTYERWCIERELGEHAKAFFNPLRGFDDVFEGENDDFEPDSE